MDVQHPVMPEVHEFRRHKAEKAATGDEIALVGGQNLLHLCFKRSAALKGFVVDRNGGQSLSFRPRKAWRFRPV